MDLKNADTLSALVGLATAVATTFAARFLGTINKSTHWQNDELKKQSSELHELRQGISRLTDHISETRIASGILTSQVGDMKRDINAAFERIRKLEVDK